MVGSGEGRVANQAGELIDREQWRTQEFCSGGGGLQQIQLNIEDRENVDLWAVAP